MSIKASPELVVAVPVAILWVLLGIVCFFWDTEAGELHFGHAITHLVFYVGTLFSVVGAFFWLVEEADMIADWWNERQS